MKTKPIIIFSAIITVFSIIAPFLVFGETEVLLKSSISDRTEKTGTYFEIQDSEYLNIILESTEEIEVILESIPRMISLGIKVNSSGAHITELTIKGLEPNKTYYKYQDSYKNGAVFVSDENGSYGWTQDLSESHHIWIQETKSTIFLPDGCGVYGAWDEATRTCILNQDLTESVEIIADNITLDCDGHSITGEQTGYGIYLKTKTDVTIKNCVIKDFSYGINLYNRSTNNKIVGNNILDNYYGIFIKYSPENYFRDNSIINNKYNFGVEGGIWELGVLEYIQDIDTSNTVDGKPIYYLVNEENIIIDATANAGFVGAVNSKNITVKDLTIGKNVQGVLFAYTNDSTIENIAVSNNQYGLFLYNSSNNNIIINNILNNYNYGIYLEHFSSNNNITGSNVLNNGWSGISMIDSSNNNIVRNNIFNNGNGISVGSGWLISTYNTIAENNISDNYDVGIDLYSSNNNIVSNDISGNGSDRGVYNTGIFLSASSNNNITENNLLSNKWTGIYISGWRDRQSKDNKIIGNNISSSDYGIYLAYSAPENYFRNNSLNNNKYGLRVYGYYGYYGYYQNNHYVQDIDISNTINGKPIYYLVNEQDKVIDNTSNAGFVGVVNSKNIIVRNVVLENNYEGVLFFNTTNSIIESINASNNNTGIGLHLSTDINIIGSKVSGNDQGIYLLHSSNNNITGNFISDNRDGIALWLSSNNGIIDNNILSNNGYGISLNGTWREGSDNNKIYHNNFIDNFRQVRLYYAINNFFDNGYPDGGNYWSDYIGVDSDGDGIGDSPYIFPGGQDNYPFMTENGWEAPPTFVFEPNEDGFGFQNFCPVYFDEQLMKQVARTWDMFTQFFGQEATMLGDDRRFTAKRYFEEEYAEYNPFKCGSCDGFSGTSLINFKNLDQPNSGAFDMSYYDNLYSQDIDNDIKEAIAYQQGFQFGQEAISYLNYLEKQFGHSPKFFYGKIKEALDNKELIIIWLQEEPKKWEVLKKGGGHALVSYKYEEDDLGEMGYVYVYDSNYPGDNSRIIEFDLEKDEWTYEFKKGFWGLGETWNGDATTSYWNIATIPLNMRLNKGIPPWAQEVSPYYYIASIGEAASPLFVNEAGERIGILDGEFIDEMPDASYFIPLAQNQDAFSGLYYLPQEDNYDLTLYGEQEGEMDFVIFGNQSSIKLASNTGIGNIDDIKLQENSLTYTTDNDYKEYSISFTKELNDLSRLIEVDTSISKGDTNVIELIEDGFKYINNGNAKTYDLTLKQKGLTEGEVYFSDVELGQNETQFINILNQNDINNSEIIIKIDENSDGTIDKKKSLQMFFEDPIRGTKLIINTANKTFHFIAPDKDFGVIKADKMDIINETQEIILVNYKDEEINFTATAMSGDMDFCSASVKDKYGKEHYLLIDKTGRE